jgi:hypothetical protein
MDPDTYCREVEAHLCRRNAGHLVRLMGPAFEKVRGWVGAGIPIRVACSGIDRYFERYDRKPRTRHRPVPLEFCEADVLEAFDEWRRAVGVGTAGSTAELVSDGDPIEKAASRSGHSLRAHLDRVATRLTDRLAAGGLPASLETHLGRLLEQLARDREAARTLRGQARDELMATLQKLDVELLEAARAASDAGMIASLGRAADVDLDGFRLRMAEADYVRARDAAVSALLRDRWRLPTLAYDK